MLGDSKKISFFPDQVLAELPIKTHKPDRMTFVAKLSTDVLDKAKSIWRDIQHNGLQSIAESVPEHADKSKKRTAEERIVFTKNKVGKGNDFKAFLQKFFMTEIPTHFQCAHEKDFTVCR